MRHMLLLALFGISTGAAFAANGPCSVRVADPRCEYLTDPLGIDVRQPRLSWRLEAVDAATRGQKQTAYQVLVARTKAFLREGKGDLWDSGTVASSQSAHVVYAGKPLTSGTQCFWMVRVKDENGAVSAWSAPARWTMGLLEPSDWSARWIGSDQVFKR
jgi:alpha-L-rhamnosidase